VVITMEVQIWFCTSCAYHAFKDVILIGWNPKYDESFLVRAISHEVLHRVLYKEIGEYACAMLDNVWPYCDLAFMDVDFEEIKRMDIGDIVRTVKMYCDGFKW